MPLSWNEIKTRALAFSKEWQNESSEDAEAKSFWDGFFNVFGITRRRVASFEVHVKELDDKDGYIDLFWRGVLVVEHKSRGKSLDKAYSQALDYFSGIAERDLPKYIIVSDFARIRLYDLEENQEDEFDLKDLHKKVRLFGFIAGYLTHKIQEQDPVNIKAAEQMGKLHDQMKESGYTGHPLELYMVRLLFCLFAEDTGIFEKQQFREYIEERTGVDGSDLGHHLSTLFQVLNTPPEKRLKNLDEQLAAFNYINGKLFEEMLPTAGFDSAMRLELLNCCALDWSRISPAIFGSLFQSIMDKAARRNLGAHYTSEENILKLIKPLFLDDLWEEFEKIKHNKNRLLDFHQKLRRLHFLDPACGCGNFLVIAYRELRLLELEILRASKIFQSEIYIHKLININVDQFYGIEIEEFPAQIAQVALWLMDHQMNMLVSEEFGLYFARIPLETSAKIIHDNALKIDWEEVISVRNLNYIMGNPPFVGAKFMNGEQREDVAGVFGNMKNAGLLDYVAAWYVKAARMIKGTKICCAFVSTNSITQGEQVGVLWNWMLAEGMKIFFAHRTFQWNNEARGKAAVHCVIVGFANFDVSPKILFEYENIKGQPHKVKAQNINPYLVDAPNILLPNIKKPICNVTPIVFGSMPNDGGNLLLSNDEKTALLEKEPQANKWLKKFLGADDFINSNPRWCLWLISISPTELNHLKYIKELVDKVKKHRLSSSRKTTIELAATPTLFGEIRQPKEIYILIPRHSSENRVYVPCGFIESDTICGDSNMLLPEASLYNFGVLTSLMHNAWLRTVCGRIKSDYRYSAGIVYNNFPWPENPTDKQKQAIEAAAQGVLDARAQFPTSSLADLYDPLSMPPALLKAHQRLDKAVDSAYGKTNFQTEAQRVAFLFELYQKYTSLFAPEKPKRRKRAS
ncbi:MAG TPA: DNA methyltransferase [Smithella sp.]|nr:DNA methyltransferase [Smithella sp.]